jgi:hypothetical protein
VFAGTGLVDARQFGRFGGVFFEQNRPPDTELVIARWRFGTNGRFGHMGWSHNYPYSEQHIAQMIGETTKVHVTPASYRIVELGSDEIFAYPFTYVSEPGEMQLTSQEVENLRQYVSRGGFVLIDDFDGPDQFATMREQFRRAFPDEEFVPLTIRHPIFRAFFDLENLDAMAPYVPGGDSVYLALFNESGDISVIACYNNDLANFWDWIDQARYPLQPSTEAFRMGVNFVVYAMTH